VPLLQQHLQTAEFTYEEHYLNEHQSKLYSCSYPALGDASNEYFKVGRCGLCDAVVRMHLGEVIREEELDGTWAFESQQKSRDFFCLCIILTTGLEEYYTSLHVRAKKIFHRSLAILGQLHGKRSGPSKATEKLRESSQFLVGFGSPSFCELPFFYVIGNPGKPGSLPHHLRERKILHDFCIAIPDLGYYCKHFGTNSKKPTRSTSAGDAVYFRPTLS
jgi:hypothetical protein